MGNLIEKKMNSQGRTFAAVLYPKYDYNHEVAFQRFKIGLFNADYFWIEHQAEEKDDDAELKDHVHILWRFTTPRYLRHCASTLGIPPNYIKRVTSYTSYLRYLIHLDNPEKICYTIDDVGCSSPAAEQILRKAVDLTLDLDSQNTDFKRLVHLAFSTSNMYDFLISVAELNLLSVYQRYQNSINKIVGSAFSKNMKEE